MFASVVYRAKRGLKPLRSLDIELCLPRCSELFERELTPTFAVRFVIQYVFGSRDYMEVLVCEIEDERFDVLG